MTLSGRFVAAAIFVIEIDEVFDERIASGDLRSRRVFRMICFLISKFSVAASTTSEQPARSSSEVVVFIRPRTARFSVLGHRLFFYKTIEAFADIRDAAVDKVLLDVAHNNIKTRSSRPFERCRCPSFPHR